MIKNKLKAHNKYNHSIQVSNQQDADLMIKDMHHFYTDPNRKLTVRLADKPAQRPGPDRSIDQGRDSRGPVGSRPPYQQRGPPFSGGGGASASGGKSWSRPTGGPPPGRSGPSISGPSAGTSSSSSSSPTG